MSTVAYRSPTYIIGNEAAMSGQVMRWTSLVMAPVIWFLPAIILCVLSWLLAGLVFLPGGFVLAPFVMLVIILSLRRYVQRRRRMNGEVILGYLDTAVRLNLPIPQFLMAAELSERGRRGRQLRGVRQALQSGFSVAAALQQAADVDPDSLAVIASYEGLGQLRTGLARLMTALPRDRKPRDTAEVDGYRIYPLFLVLLSCFGALLYAVFIVPKMREIFRDFKIDLPPVTQFVINCTSWLPDSPVLMILFLVLTGLVIYVPLSIAMQQVFLPFWKMPRFDEWFARLAWRLFPVRRILIDRGMAFTCELLAEAAATGIPLPIALERALQLPVNPGFKVRLANFRNLILTGSNPADAAREARLPALFVGLLAPLSAGSDATAGAEMFAFLGRYYRNKFSRTLTLLRAAITPILVLLAGAIVLTLSTALVKPVVALIDDAIKKGGFP